MGLLFVASCCRIGVSVCPPLTTPAVAASTPRSVTRWASKGLMCVSGQRRCKFCELVSFTACEPPPSSFLKDLPIRTPPLLFNTCRASFLSFFLPSATPDSFSLYIGCLFPCHIHCCSSLVSVLWPQRFGDCKRKDLPPSAGYTLERTETTATSHLPALFVDPANLCLIKGPSATATDHK
jgi:hypothetical protein